MRVKDNPRRIMNLKELKESVDLLVANGMEDREVVVTIDRPSFGPMASVAVVGLYPGIDWENHQVRIDLSAPVIEKSKDRDEKMVMKKNPVGRGWICPACGYFVHAGDRFCHNCGQRLVDGERQKKLGK